MDGNSSKIVSPTHTTHKVTEPHFQHTNLTQFGAHGAGLPDAASSAFHVLLLEDLLFVLAAFLAFDQLRKILSARKNRSTANPTVQQAPRSQEGGRTRSLFIFLLFLSCLARAGSLLVLAYVEGRRSGPLPRRLTWLVYSFKLLPSLCFLATYSILALFWAQVYFAAMLVARPKLPVIVATIDLSIIGCFLLIAGISYATHSFRSLVLYSSILLGLTYAAIAIAFAYYGLKVASHLGERSKAQERTKSVIRRVVFLAISCPLIFAMRAAYSIVFDVAVALRTPTLGLGPAAWDNTIYFVCEWIPSAIILAAFWNKKNRSNSMPARQELWRSVDVSSIDMQHPGGLQSPLIPSRAGIEQVPRIWRSDPVLTRPAGGASSIPRSFSNGDQGLNNVGGIHNSTRGEFVSDVVHLT